MQRETMIELSGLIQDSCRHLYSQYRIFNRGIQEKDLAWYMPPVFIKALEYHYYRYVVGIQLPEIPRMMGIDIKEGYEPLVVLTCTAEYGFTKPELTLRGPDLVTKSTPEHNGKR